MALIYRVTLRCPNTGKTIDSGVRTTGREALSSGLYDDGSIVCPHCGQVHTFKGNSYLDVDKVAPAKGLWRPNQ